MDEVILRRAFIKMKDPSNEKLREEIMDAIEDSIYTTRDTTVDLFMQKQQSNEALNLIDTIFYVTIAIMMFLCFFALQGSMSSNMFEQTKEIGVLRAIGFTSLRICLLYFYEAILLVLASCLLGVFIGVLVGMTMVMQQDLFMARPFEFYFPWRQTLEIFILSIICAFLSTFGPAYQLTRKEISEIFRIL